MKFKLLGILLFLCGFFYLFLAYMRQDESTSIHLFEALILLFAGVGLFFYRR